jgi:hypothetical protein
MKPEKLTIKKRMPHVLKTVKRFQDEMGSEKGES